MKRGLYLAPFHELADPRLLAELARVAESRGRDGLFLWDRIAYPPSDRAVGGTQRYRFQDGQPSYRADDHSALAEARPEGRTGDGHDRTTGGVRDRTGPGRKRAHSHGRAGGEQAANTLQPDSTRHYATTATARSEALLRRRCWSREAVLAFTRQRPRVLEHVRTSSLARHRASLAATAEMMPRPRADGEKVDLDQRCTLRLSGQRGETSCLVAAVTVEP